MRVHVHAGDALAGLRQPMAGERDVVQETKAAGVFRVRVVKTAEEIESNVASPDRSRSAAVSPAPHAHAP